MSGCNSEAANLPWGFCTARRLVGYDQSRYATVDGCDAPVALVLGDNVYERRNEETMTPSHTRAVCHIMVCLEHEDASGRSIAQQLNNIPIWPKCIPTQSA